MDYMRQNRLVQLELLDVRLTPACCDLLGETIAACLNLKHLVLDFNQVGLFLKKKKDRLEIFFCASSKNLN